MATVSIPYSNPATDTGFFVHPRGLLLCFTTELCERFSFYVMK